MPDKDTTVVMCISVLWGINTNTLSEYGRRETRKTLDLSNDADNSVETKPQIPCTKPVVERGTNAAVKTTLALFSIICSRKALKLI